MTPARALIAPITIGKLKRPNRYTKRRAASARVRHLIATATVDGQSVADTVADTGYGKHAVRARLFVRSARLIRAKYPGLALSCISVEQTLNTRSATLKPLRGTPTPVLVRVPVARTKRGLAPVPREPGTVYFIRESGTDCCKVGFTTGPVANRVLDLQVANSRELVIVCTIPGTWGDEQAIHRQLDAHHIRGEWFTLTDGQARAFARAYLNAA